MLRNARAWLMTVAKRRAIGTFRRNRDLQDKYAQIARALEEEGGPSSSGRLASV